MYKLQCRREHETREHRRLLDKQQRLEAILASLVQSGAESAQKEEIEEMMTPVEKAQLAKVKHMKQKLVFTALTHRCTKAMTRWGISDIACSVASLILLSIAPLILLCLLHLLYYFVYCASYIALSIAPLILLCIIRLL